MVDSYDEDGVLGLLDPIDHAIGATAREVVAGEVEHQGLSDPMRILEQRPGGELDDRGCRELGEAGEGL